MNVQVNCLLAGFYNCFQRNYIAAFTSHPKLARVCRQAMKEANACANQTCLYSILASHSRTNLENACHNNGFALAATFSGISK